MFNLAEWLKESMISGVVNGRISQVHVALKAKEYLNDGTFTEVDVQEIAERAIEPVVAIPEPVEDESEGDISG